MVSPLLPQDALPALERLHLNGNRLTAVRPPRTPSSFPSLRALLLASNALSAWASVDALDSFPRLAEARLSGNPLAEAAGAAARHEAVARVRGLALLNGALVGRAERRDAEIRYLRRALDEASVAPPSDPSAPAEHHHPRMAALLEQFGQLAPGSGGGAAAAPVGGACLADDMLSLTLVCGEAKPMAKRLPRTTQVGMLAQLCARLFRLPAAGVALALRRGGTGTAEVLEETQRDLHWLGAASGDIIEVSLLL